jgi:hypothetical protein
MSTGSPNSDSLSFILGAMKDLRATWPSRGWSWDKRVSCVTSSFVVELEAKARAAAATILPTEWTSTTIGRASPTLREIAERTGGLRAGQIITVSGGAGTGFAYSLWWPWGDGMTTSARIGLGGSFASESALEKLRDVFGVEA